MQNKRLKSLVERVVYHFLPDGAECERERRKKKECVVLFATSGRRSILGGITLKHYNANLKLNVLTKIKAVQQLVDFTPLL